MLRGIYNLIPTESTILAAPFHYPKTATLLLLIVALRVATYIKPELLSWSELCSSFSKPEIIPQTLPKIIPQTFSDKVNLIAATFFEKFSKQPKATNFSFFMPSLLPNLLMLYGTAPDDLKKAFDREFYWGSGEGLNQECSTWLQSLAPTASEESTITQAQAVAIKEGFEILPGAQQVFQRYDAETMQFETPQEAHQQANMWVDQKTAGAMRDCFKIESPLTVLVFLTTAIFKGSWLYPFDKRKTTKEVFYNGDGTKTAMDQMRIKCDEFQAGELNNFRALKIPFRGSVSMVFFLPRIGETNKGMVSDALQALSQLTADKIVPFLSNPASFKKKESLEVGIPRLKLEHQTSLTEDLKEWSLMQKIIKADLRTSLATGPQPLHVRNIAMQTSITVDEEGAQIQAATYTPVYEQSCPPRPFYINRPFAYAFFDEKTQTIVGMGRVTKLPGEEPNEQLLTLTNQQRSGWYLY